MSSRSRSTIGWLLIFRSINFETEEYTGLLDLFGNIHARTLRGRLIGVALTFNDTIFPWQGPCALLTRSRILKSFPRMSVYLGVAEVRTW